LPSKASGVQLLAINKSEQNLEARQQSNRPTRAQGRSKAEEANQLSEAKVDNLFPPTKLPSSHPTSLGRLVAINRISTASNG